jgi:hypothetical protein
MNTPEVKEIPRVEALNRYLEDKIAWMKEAVASMPEEVHPDWEPLNRLFLEIVDL